MLKAVKRITMQDPSTESATHILESVPLLSMNVEMNFLKHFLVALDSQLCVFIHLMQRLPFSSTEIILETVLSFMLVAVHS
jgi:hypothetical protein